MYKVHSYGDIYVVMSYNGKVPKDKRNTNCVIEEAYQTILMGIDMAETVNQLSEKVQGSHASKIEIQIGIHSGKITGGLIGQNHVRYDIFGNSVLTAALIMAESPAGTIRVSGETHNLI